MKTVQILLQRISCMVVLISGTASLFAQKDQTIPIKDIIGSRHYIFKAQTVSPTGGRTRQLNTGYTLKVFNDTIIADLPYFGRAYAPPSNLAGGGISFTSLKHDYTVLQDKKKRWQITIKPSDANDVENLSLTVFEDGTADLTVNSRDRQPISFRGYISGNSH
ncbi:MAG: DUF4251 domain-containing protein [Bacteroidota bacterium]|nr:DUF4251 domain-containing protein [Bacteroidota bacterium]